MVIGNIHSMIGEATRRCVQHVYKHCWKCRDVACHNQGATDSAYLPGIPLELRKACVRHVANPNSLACRPILASSGSKILLDFGCWQPSADGTFGESRAETPPGIMVTANLTVFAITGVSGRDKSSRGQRGMVLEPDRRLRTRAPQARFMADGVGRHQPAPSARQPSLVRGVQPPLGAFTPRTRRATHSRSSARHCD